VTGDDATQQPLRQRFSKPSDDTALDAKADEWLPKDDMSGMGFDVWMS